MKKLIAFILSLGAVSALAGLPATQVQTNYRSSNLSTSVWGTIVSSVQKEIGHVDVYNSSISGTVILGVGNVGSEYNALYIPPGVSKVIPLTIHRNSRISLKALNSTITAGETVLNFME